MSSRKKLFLGLGLFLNLLFYASAAYIISTYRPSLYAQHTQLALVEILTRFHKQQFDRVSLSTSLIQEFLQQGGDADFIKHRLKTHNISGVYDLYELPPAPLVHSAPLPPLPPTLFKNSRAPQMFLHPVDKKYFILSVVFEIEKKQKQWRTYAVTYPFNRPIFEAFTQDISLDYSVYSFDDGSNPELVVTSYNDTPDWLRSAIKHQNFSFSAENDLLHNHPLPSFEVVSPQDGPVLVVPIAITISRDIKQVIFYSTPATYLRNEYRNTTWILLALFIIVSTTITAASYYFSQKPYKK